ncbi:MAG: threonine/serine exporter family protein [Candidatus Caenarcaniphilales bacterium]|nr:threonine/serine exporter family protein [Candidatus Caenarcaniphilales bacterium]
MGISSTFNEKINFVAALALALHKYGLAAHNLEGVVNNVSHSLKLEVEVFSTPTLLLLDFTDPLGLEVKQVAKRLKPGDINLDLLSRIDELGDRVMAGDIGAKAAFEELKLIQSEKELYPPIYEALAFSAIAFTISIFFGANLIALLLSSVGGLIVGLVCVYLTKVIDIGRFLELMLAFLISFLTICIFHFYPLFTPNLVNISSLIFLVPGVGLTIAMTELATDNLVSGTARFMGAMMNLFKLVFGLVIGTYFGTLVVGETTIIDFEVVKYPFFLQVLALFIVAVAFTILMKTKFENYFWILAAAFLGFSSYKFILDFTSEPFIATFLASFTVSLLGSFYARFFKHPAVTVLIPGITLLVPGSMGLRGLSLVLQEDTVLGVNTLIKVFFTGIAIVAGLLLANICLPPKRSL